MKNLWKSISNRIIYLVPVFSLVCAWFELELSSGWTSKTKIFMMDIRYIVLNILTLAVVYGVLVILTNRYIVAGIIFNCIMFLIAVINYYTVALHGSPLSVQEIGNFKTAVNVLGNYDIVIDKYVGLIICLFILNIAISCLFVKKEKRCVGKWILIRDLILVLAGVVVMYAGYFSDSPIKPKRTIISAWEGAYHTYGYVACTVESTLNMFHIYNEPEGYSPEKHSQIEMPPHAEGGATPDIILILNESFYDLSMVTDIETDVPYLENIYNLDNAIRGYAVVPNSGGGTNNSEYELLTSNSLQLFNNVTPFNVLDMKDTNSIVSGLKQLGYSTLATHPSASTNYNRNRAYPNMGFEKIVFKDEFETVEYYEQRDMVTDACVYQNLFGWYEQKDETKPFFAYLLTIQNHGGWEMNDESADMVHVLNDYGELTGQLNEYLTGIHMSDLAFMELVEYFEQVDRPVIVCMVGDHAPSFITEVTDESFSGTESQVRRKSTPFVIWANYDIEEKDMGHISLNYMVPTLLEAAGTRMSPYYEYMVQLRENVPILTSTGYYITNDEKVYSYDDNAEYSKDVNDYFYLEYNNLQNGFGEELFQP